MLPLIVRSVLLITVVISLTACDYLRSGYIATESEARETCDIALKSNFADLKIATTDIPSPTMKRQDSPDRWMCEYRIGRVEWIVGLDPSSGHAELSRFEAR